MRDGSGPGSEPACSRGFGNCRGEDIDSPQEDRMSAEHLITAFYVFVLAAFLGYLVISRVPPLLHTPLMSATNAISGISLIGSLVVAGSETHWVSTVLGCIAVGCSSTNVVGGFLITDRMLKMFKTERKAGDEDRWYKLENLF